MAKTLNRFPEQMTTKYEPGTMALIDKCLTASDTRQDFVRAAVDRELSRRLAAQAGARAGNDS